MAAKQPAVSFQCPKCERWLRDASGTVIQCPGCRASVTVPPPPPAVIRFKCPACSKGNEVGSDLAGQPSTCQACGEVVRVPDGARRPQEETEEDVRKKNLTAYVLIAFGLPLVLAALLYQMLSEGEHKQPGGRGSGARVSAEVQSVRLQPFRAAAGFDTQMVYVDWLNTGDRPVRRVSAQIRVFDARGVEVYEVPSYPIYAVSSDRPGVPPGHSRFTPTGEGFMLAITPGLSAVRATAEITNVGEAGF